MKALGAAIVCALALYAVDNLYYGGTHTAALNQLIANAIGHF
jgi:hypothetical protein